ncbi:hypothetical protein EDB89DRAFT_862661 [Lactarius sanguifluus]|nr:hypothetical protein EDB89DRAFT_862661 [Lactarius sanguifluus]
MLWKGCNWVGSQKNERTASAKARVSPSRSLHRDPHRFRPPLLVFLALPQTDAHDAAPPSGNGSSSPLGLGNTFELSSRGSPVSPSPLLCEAVSVCASQGASDRSFIWRPAHHPHPSTKHSATWSSVFTAFRLGLSCPYDVGLLRPLLRQYQHWYVYLQRAIGHR